jgi:LacI family transcriptional regulator
MIFCGSDAIALGCLEALAERGLRVPDDVSVAGFDDTLAARITMPQLASVRQPLSAMGGKAVDLLLAQIEPRAGQPLPLKSLVFPTELVLRASLAPPPVRRD